jgi:hypothetical protein
MNLEMEKQNAKLNNIYLFILNHSILQNVGAIH